MAKVSFDRSLCGINQVSIGQSKEQTSPVQSDQSPEFTRIETGDMTVISYSFGQRSERSLCQTLILIIASLGNIICKYQGFRLLMYDVTRAVFNSTFAVAGMQIIVRTA